MTRRIIDRTFTPRAGEAVLNFEDEAEGRSVECFCLVPEDPLARLTCRSEGLGLARPNAEIFLASFRSISSSSSQCF